MVVLRHREVWYGAHSHTASGLGNEASGPAFGGLACCYWRPCSLVSGPAQKHHEVEVEGRPEPAGQSQQGDASGDTFMLDS